MISPSFMLVLLVSYVSVEGSSASSDHLKDPVVDLARLPKVEASLSDQKLDEVASANYHQSVLPVADELLLPAQQFSSLPDGKRRLDSAEDNTALASISGHSRPYLAHGNNRLQRERELLSASRLGDYVMKSSRYRGDAEKRSDLDGQKRRSKQRQNAASVGRHRETGSRRQEAALSRQESRKNQRKPEVGGSRRAAPIRVNDANEDDGEDSEDASSDRRADSAGERNRSDELNADQTDTDPDAGPVIDEPRDSGQLDEEPEEPARLGRQSSRNKRTRVAASERANLRQDDGESSDQSDQGDDPDADSSRRVDSRPSDGGAGDGLRGRRPSEPTGRLDEEQSDASASHLRRSSADLQVAAGHNHGHHDHYYQYVEVPKKKSWKFGFKRGNHKHTIERHEKGHKNKFHSTFKWHAMEKCKKKKHCKSVGKMTWDYKHHDKKHHP